MDRVQPPAPSAWQQLGPHRFAVDYDTLYWCPSGVINEQEGVAISDQFVAIAKARGYVLILIEGRNSPPLRPEVRRTYADKITRHRVRMAVAVYGGNATSRVMATLTVHAARLLSGLEMEIRYTATEPEARQFLTEQRERLRKLS